MTTNEQLINKKIGRIIARKRQRAGLTQEQVAERLGIGTEAFSRIERGVVSAGIARLYELATLFQCGADTFLVEGSHRPADQAGHIAELLAPLSPDDRQLIIGMVEKLSGRFQEKVGAKGEARAKRAEYRGSAR